MPLHDFRCNQGHTFESAVQHGVDALMCPSCMTAGVANPAHKIFLKAPVGFVQKDICYDSPIDGRAITNKQARIEDLRRNGCVEYDPEMKKDAERRRLASDRALDHSIEQHVDEFFATAPVRKLETLEQELRAGASAEVQRSTPDTTKGVVE
jgi:hypothetical protein